MTCATTNTTHHEIRIEEIVQFQLLVHFQAVLLHLLLLLFGKIIVLPLNSATLLHLIAAQPLANLKTWELRGLLMKLGMLD